MGEFAECLIGIKEACEYLNFPVVSEMYLFITELTKKIFFPLLLLVESV